MNIFKRIKIYFFLKNLGINRPWKASGDKNFITFGWKDSASALFFSENKI